MSCPLLGLGTSHASICHLPSRSRDTPRLMANSESSIAAAQQRRRCRATLSRVTGWRKYTQRFGEVETSIRRRSDWMARAREGCIRFVKVYLQCATVYSHWLGYTAWATVLAAIGCSLRLAAVGLELDLFRVPIDGVGESPLLCRGGPLHHFCFCMAILTDANTKCRKPVLLPQADVVGRSVLPLFLFSFPVSVPFL